MRNILQTIARENYRKSGYITHPGREQRTPWTFASPPRSPFFTTNAVRDAIQRREHALLRHKHKPESFLRHFLNAFIRR